MVIPVQNYPIIQQNSNPVLDRMSQALQFAFAPNALQQESTKNDLANKLSQLNLDYAPREKELGLTSKNLANRIAEINLAYAPQEKRAHLDLIGAQIPSLRAQTSLNELKGQYPGILNNGLSGQIALAQYLIDQKKGQNLNPGNPNLNVPALPITNGQANNLNKIFPGTSQQMANLPNPQLMQQQIQTGNSLADVLLNNMHAKYQATLAQTNANQAKAQSLNPEQQINIANQKEEAKANIKNYGKATEDAQNAANTSQQLINYAKKFKDAYKKVSFYKGPLLGSLPSSGFGSPPGISSAAQLADNYSQNMQLLLANSLKSARLTNYLTRFAGALKLNRSQRPEAVNEIYKNIIAASTRASELPLFLASAKSKNIPLNQAYAAWDLYNEKEPPIDINQLKPINKNNGKWKDYLSKGSINAIRQGKNYQSPNNDDPLGIR